MPTNHNPENKECQKNIHPNRHYIGNICKCPCTCPSQEPKEERKPQFLNGQTFGCCGGMLIHQPDCGSKPSEQDWEKEFDEIFAKLGDVLELSGITKLKNFIRSLLSKTTLETEARGYERGKCDVVRYLDVREKGVQAERKRIAEAVRKYWSSSDVLPLEEIIKIINHE